MHDVRPRRLVEASHNTPLPSLPPSSYMFIPMLVVISGASRGIGLAFASQLLRRSSDSVIVAASRPRRYGDAATALHAHVAHGSTSSSASLSVLYARQSSSYTLPTAVASNALSSDAYSENHVEPLIAVSRR